MKRELDDELVARGVARAMDQQLANQDAEVQFRLAAMRRQALAKGPSSSLVSLSGLIRHWRVRGAALATAMTIVVIMITVGLPFGTPRSLVEDGLELAILVEDAELYTDMEFYYWLDQQGASREL